MLVGTLPRVVSLNNIIYWRIVLEIAKMVEEVSRSLGLDKSDFIRMAVREKLAEMSFLDEKTKKVFKVLKRV